MIDLVKAITPSWLKRWRRSFIEEVSRRRHALHVARLRRACISKPEFLRDLKFSIDHQQPYAAGRLGASEEYWLYYSALVAQGKTSKARTLVPRLAYHFHNQTSLFPISLDFIYQYAEFYGKCLKQLDVLGICYSPWEWTVLKHYKIYPRASTKLVFYTHQEPDRSIPNRDDLCYLPYFRDKKILIICPFASLLASRANREVFEGVWSKTGKPWFYPASVDALEFPYGLAEETQKRYGNAINLYTAIAEEMAQRSFDVALVAAAGLGTPIVAEAKRLGKTAIYLGGHLQVVFGVVGKRWREREDWRTMYFNEYWIDMPEAYRPKELTERRVVQLAGFEPFVLEGGDSGAYW